MLLYRSGHGLIHRGIHKHHRIKHLHCSLTVKPLLAHLHSDILADRHSVELLQQRRAFLHLHVFIFKLVRAEGCGVCHSQHIPVPGKIQERILYTAEITRTPHLVAADYECIVFVLSDILESLDHTRRYHLVDKPLSIGRNSRKLSAESDLAEHFRSCRTLGQTLQSSLGIDKWGLPQGRQRHLDLTVQNRGLMSHGLQVCLQRIGLKNASVICVQRQCHYSYPHRTILFLMSERNLRTFLYIL